MNKFYMVLVAGSKGCSRRHLNIDDARKEADRVSGMVKNAGKEVIILEAIEYKSAAGEWTKTE